MEWMTWLILRGVHIMTPRPPEENRYLPVFILLSVIITVQSFLIGQDRKQSEFDRPVVTLSNSFVTRPPGPWLPPTPEVRGDAIPPPASGGIALTLNPRPGAPPSPAATPVTPVNTPAPVKTPPHSQEESGSDHFDLTTTGNTRAPAPVISAENAVEAQSSGDSESESAPAVEGEASAEPVSVAATDSQTCEVDIGDNLWKIAQRYHVSPEDLLRANNLKDGTLTPGQVLIIPTEAVPQSPGAYSTYTIKENESAIDVANKLGIPLIDLVRENDLSSLYQIAAGTKLKYRRVAAAQPREVRSRPARHLSFTEAGLSFPVGGAIGDRFGWRLHPILGETLFHTGVDLKAHLGDSIRASQDGRVIYSGWLKGYGRTLVLRHTDGFTTRYAHCSALLKKRGDRVRRGERIARVGSSGMSTGPHVHFEVRQYGKPLNPLRYLSRNSSEET
jgi:murein DD-endopeptidase MepM/ murein hydrolase activator NlpD